MEVNVKLFIKFHQVRFDIWVLVFKFEYKNRTVGPKVVMEIITREVTQRPNYLINNISLCETNYLQYSLTLSRICKLYIFDKVR